MKDECLSEQAVLYGDMIYTTTLWIEENTSGSLRSSLKYLLSQLVEYGTDDIVYAQIWLSLAGWFEFCAGNCGSRRV